MTGRIAQALDARHASDPFEKTRQRPGTGVRTFAVISIDVLADQRDLAHAGFRKRFDFPKHALDRTRQLSAARVRHHAKGTKLVAAFLHRDEGVDARARIAAALGAAR